MGLLTLACAGWHPAQAQALTDFPRSDDYLLLEYSRYSGKLADRDPTPALRLYGSGRALVYWPSYTPRAGLYEIRLPAAAVDALVRRIVRDELHQLPAMDLMLAAEQAEARLQAGGTVHYSSDETVTQLEVHLPAARRDPLIAVNLQATDRRLPGLPGVSGFAALARELQAVVDGDLGAPIGRARPMAELERR